MWNQKSNFFEVNKAIIKTNLSFINFNDLEI